MGNGGGVLGPRVGRKLHFGDRIAIYKYNNVYERFSDFFSKSLPVDVSIRTADRFFGDIVAVVGAGGGLLKSSAIAQMGELHPFQTRGHAQVALVAVSLRVRSADRIPFICALDF